MPRLWQEPAAELRPTCHGIQLSLRRSGLVRRLQRLFLVLVLLYLAELALLGQWVIAAVAATLAALHARSCRPGRVALPRRLLIGSYGRLHLLGVAGELTPATIHPASLRLGPWLLLVLQDHAGMHRLLLGPDNLEAGQLAALRRRVAALAQRPGGTR